MIEYASGDPQQPAPKLYVPVSEAHLVSKYVGAGKARPSLNTLGGARWAKAKAQAEHAVRDLAAEMGVASHLIDDARSLQPHWFDHVRSVGITAGASAPEHLVQDVVTAIAILRSTVVETLSGTQENTRFKLPPEVTGENLLRIA